MNIRESKPFTTYQVSPIFNDGRPHGTDWPNAESEEKARLIAQQYLRDNQSARASLSRLALAVHRHQAISKAEGVHPEPLDEALWAATRGGALALQRDDLGVLRPGAVADLVVLDAPSHLHLAYRPGVPLVRRVLAAGVLR